MSSGSVTSFGVRTLRKDPSAPFKSSGSSRTARGKPSSNSSSSSHSQLKAVVILSAGHHHRRLVAAATAAMVPAQAEALTLPVEAGLAGRSMTACKFLQALWNSIQLTQCMHAARLFLQRLISMPGCIQTCPQLYVFSCCSQPILLYTNMPRRVTHSLL